MHVQGIEPAVWVRAGRGWGGYIPPSKWSVRSVTLLVKLVEWGGFEDILTSLIPRGYECKNLWHILIPKYINRLFYMYEKPLPKFHQSFTCGFQSAQGSNFNQNVFVSDMKKSWSNKITVSCVRHIDTPNKGSGV